MADRAECVLEGYPVVERVTRHSSEMMMKRLEARQNVVHLDVAAEERLENRSALRTSELALDAVACIRLTQRLAAAFHLGSADRLRSSRPGADDIIHAVVLSSSPIVAGFGLYFIIIVWLRRDRLKFGGGRSRAVSSRLLSDPGVDAWLGL